jgi:hypothetical protein
MNSTAPRSKDHFKTPADNGDSHVIKTEYHCRCIWIEESVIPSTSRRILSDPASQLASLTFIGGGHCITLKANQVTRTRRPMAKALLKNEQPCCEEFSQSASRFRKPSCSFVTFGSAKGQHVQCHYEHESHKIKGSKLTGGEGRLLVS